MSKDKTTADSRKQITFDLDTTDTGLKRFYDKPRASAYAEIQAFLHKHNFEHTQYSVYESKDKMDYPMATSIFNKALKQLPWLPLCLGNCTVTEIGEQTQLYSPKEKERRQNAYLAKQQREQGNTTSPTALIRDTSDMTFGQIKQIISDNQAMRQSNNAINHTATIDKLATSDKIKDNQRNAKDRHNDERSR